jgi:hypothetical protein
LATRSQALACLFFVFTTGLDMHQPPSSTTNRAEPSHGALAIHMSVLLAMLALLGVMVIAQPFANERLRLLVTLGILASITVSGRFLSRERRAPVLAPSEVVS